MSRSYWISLLLLTFVLLGCTKEEMQSVPPELENKIVFQCSEGICTINPDGTDLKVVVPSDSGGPFLNPQWSPDKRRIGFTGHVFTGHVEWEARVMLVNSDGSNLQIIQLPESKKGKSKPKPKPKQGIRIALAPYHLSFSDWSPGGERFSTWFYGGFDGHGNILIMDIKGSELFRSSLGSYSRFCGENRVVFVTSAFFQAGKNDIVSLDFVSGTKEDLTNGKKYFHYPPVVSPDEKRIAYTFDPLWGKGELWIMDMNGSNKMRLAGGDADFPDRSLTAFSFSPDGRKILFVAFKKREKIGELYTIDVEGTGLKKITDSIVIYTDSIVIYRGGASWSPDGNQIVFTSAKDGNDELYIINFDGTGLTRLTNNTTMDCCPDW